MNSKNSRRRMCIVVDALNKLENSVAVVFRKDS